MNNHVVFESPKRMHKRLIMYYIATGHKVYIVKPFHAYHYQGVYRFFPSHLPKYIYKLLDGKKINLITETDIDTRWILSLAADKAVEEVEKIYPQYCILHYRLIKFVCKVLNSAQAETIFKKEFCDKLAVFYSANIMLHRIKNRLIDGKITIYPCMNILSYLRFKKMVTQCAGEVFTDNPIKFAPLAYILSFILLIKENIFALGNLFVQALGGLFLGWIPGVTSLLRKKESYRYGTLVLNASRQLSEGRRVPNFLVDNKSMFDNEMLYLYGIKLSKAQKDRLRKLGGGTFELPNRKYGNFSHPLKWIILFWLSLATQLFRSNSLIKNAHLIFSDFFRWQKVMKKVGIKHLISHSDFGFLHIARNICLKQYGVETWYFTDSINYSLNFQSTSIENKFRSPLWTYLYYDNFVTWNKAMIEYFNIHYSLIGKNYVVGCLWAGHITDNTVKNKKLVLAVFDTSYSCNSLTSYAEGIAFANDIIRLTEEFPDDLQVIFKEKNPRQMHKFLDGALGEVLLSLYKHMEERKNIKICSNIKDTSEIISFSDMVISFPFTSTTFEALSVNKPAIWHDPLGYYRDTLYGRMVGVVTHSYEELRSKVLQVRNLGPKRYTNSIVKDSPYMDPYRDGKAIDRFRELLVET